MEWYLILVIPWLLNTKFWCGLSGSWSQHTWYMVSKYKLVFWSTVWFYLFVNCWLVVTFEDTSQNNVLILDLRNFCLSLFWDVGNGTSGPNTKWRWSHVLSDNWRHRISWGRRGLSHASEAIWRSRHFEKNRFRVFSKKCYRKTKSIIDK